MRMFKKILPYIIGLVAGMILAKNQTASSWISKIPVIGPMLAGGATSTDKA